jgi:hypothetical protein
LGRLCYITEELLDEETTDMKIDGMYSHFDAATPAYEAEFWVEHFVWDLFSQERSHFLDILQNQPWYNMNGEPVSATEIVAKIETIWERMPVMERASTVTAVVAWPSGEDERQQVEACNLNPCSRYFSLLTFHFHFSLLTHD